jgi:hypothetical protein
MKKVFYEYTTDFLFDKEYFNSINKIHKRIDKIKQLSEKSKQHDKKACYIVNISIMQQTDKPVYIDYLQNFYILKNQTKTLKHMLEKLDNDFKTKSFIYYFL